MEIMEKNTPQDEPDTHRDEEDVPETRTLPSVHRTESHQEPLEVPAFLKRETVTKNAQVFVQKGQVITHYQDDMDVPTFLRKQMQ